MHNTPNIPNLRYTVFAHAALKPDLIPDEAHVTLQYTTPAVNKGAVKASG